MKSFSWLSIASKIPSFLWGPVSNTGARASVKLQTRGVRQWSLNFQVITGNYPSRLVQLEAVKSWLRNMTGSLTLAKLTNQQLVDLVVIDEEDLGKYRETASHGVVLALPHMGNWDLAGAWSTLIGLPISSVAERLPAADFNFFMALRSKLGMKIYAHDDPKVMESLRNDLRAGRVVALLADRNFSKHGITVNWQTVTGEITLQMPPGPAVLAKSTKSFLLPTATFFSGNKMRIVFGDPISPDTSVEAATQELADFFAVQIQQHPTDWHVMQKFFPGIVA